MHLWFLVIWRSFPPSDISTETFWKNEKDAWNALNGVYAQLPGMDIRDEMYTDNAHSHKPWEDPYELVQTNGITAEEDFGYNYSMVRIANNFILNVDKCDIDETLKERMKSEARIQNKGWDNEVQMALNDLRDRCSIPNVPASLSKDEAV